MPCGRRWSICWSGCCSSRSRVPSTWCTLYASSKAPTTCCTRTWSATVARTRSTSPSTSTSFRRRSPSKWYDICSLSSLLSRWSMWFYFPLPVYTVYTVYTKSKPFSCYKFKICSQISYLTHSYSSECWTVWIKTNHFAWHGDRHSVCLYKNYVSEHKTCDIMVPFSRQLFTDFSVIHTRLFTVGTILFPHRPNRQVIRLLFLIKLPTEVWLPTYVRESYFVHASVFIVHCQELCRYRQGASRGRRPLLKSVLQTSVVKLVVLDRNGFEFVGIV